jgi:hypothetical protein
MKLRQANKIFKRCRRAGHYWLRYLPWLKRDLGYTPETYTRMARRLDGVPQYGGSVRSDGTQRGWKTELSNNGKWSKSRHRRAVEGGWAPNYRLPKYDLRPLHERINDNYESLIRSFTLAEVGFRGPALEPALEFSTDVLSPRMSYRMVASFQDHEYAKVTGMEFESSTGSLDGWVMGQVFIGREAQFYMPRFEGIPVELLLGYPLRMNTTLTRGKEVIVHVKRTHGSEAKLRIRMTYRPLTLEYRTALAR